MRLSFAAAGAGRSDQIKVAAPTKMSISRRNEFDG